MFFARKTIVRARNARAENERVKEGHLVKTQKSRNHRIQIVQRTHVGNVQRHRYHVHRLARTDAGKSNVVDAISWYSANKSHKSLRAGRMSD